MASYVWRVQDGSFNLAADWTNADTGASPAQSAPGGADAASFSGTGGTVTGTGAVALLNFLPSGSWTVAGQLAAGTINVTDTLALANGGRLTLTGPGILSVGSGTASGSLTVNAGATLTTPLPAQNHYVVEVGATASSNGASGTLTVQGSGATMNLGSTGADVGLAGRGTLNVLAGGSVSLGTADAAAVAGLSVGRGGTGTVVVSGAGSVLNVAGGWYAGRASGSSGSVTVSDGGVLNATPVGTGDYVTLGSGGTINGSFATGGSGTLTIGVGGRANLVAPLNIGSSGASGTLRVSGTGVLQTSSSILLGTGTTAPGGTGLVAVLGGGTVRSTAAADTNRSYLQVGSAASTGGTVVVDGAGSLLDLGANAISVGNVTGTDSLTVSNGGTVRASTADSRFRAALGVGSVAGSNGTVSVTGAGSAMVAGGYVYIGRAGAGTLVVDQGGSFTGGSAATGSGAGASGAFAIAIGDGTPNTDPNGNPNSPLNYGGTGTARISNASLLHSLGGISVGYRGTSGTVVVDSASQMLADTTIQIGTGTDRPGGNGNVTVQGGSTLRSGGHHALGSAGISLGGTPGTAGVITVTGAGSLVDAAGDRITVGYSGSGTLNVQAGARALAGAAYADTEAALAVGGASGGSGAVSITGTGSQLAVAGTAVLGGTDIGAGLAVGGTGTVSVADHGNLQTQTMTVFGGSALTLDATASTLVNGSISDYGTVASSGALVVTGTLAGSGTLNVGGGLVDVGNLGATTVAMTGTAGTLRVHGLSGASTVTSMNFGETIDLAGMTGVTLSGTTLSTSSGSLTLDAAPSGYSYKLYGDGEGGTELLLNPANAPANAIVFTDATTNQSGRAQGVEYAGPVDYLQRQYIYHGTNPVALKATVPNAFIKGGPGGDALEVTGGNNVIDGGGGSNFLVGGTGADGGRDTFYVDARGGVVTWSTIRNFHQGDRATIFGFHPQLSTMPITASDGAAGYTGATIHSEIDGPGSGVTASFTFAGISADTASHFNYSAGTLPGSNGAAGTDYLLITYT